MESNKNPEAIVSVIITNFKYEKYVLQAAKSAFNACTKANVPHEVIIVTDDPDSSFNIGLKNEKNMGVSYSRNRGIKECSGDFIVILDGDDMLTPSSIATQLEIFKKKPGLELLHGYVYRFEGDAGYDECLKIQDKLKTHPSLITCQGMMVRRSVFEKYGLYFEGLRSAEDKELLYRWGLHRNSPLPKIIKSAKTYAATAFYRRHGNSKRKRRKYDVKFEMETMRAFDGRVMQMVQHGVTSGVELLKSIKK